MTWTSRVRSYSPVCVYKQLLFAIKVNSELRMLVFIWLYNALLVATRRPTQASTFRRWREDSFQSRRVRSMAALGRVGRMVHKRTTSEARWMAGQGWEDRIQEWRSMPSRTSDGLLENIRCVEDWRGGVAAVRPLVTWTSRVRSYSPVCVYKQLLFAIKVNSELRMLASIWLYNALL